MSRTERSANLIGVVVPFAGVVVASVLLWNRAVDVSDLALLGVTYLTTAVGITVGFHRLLTHRAFQTHALVWGGLVRIFLVHHVTWSVNSICHFFGSRRFDVDDHSTNVGWLAVLSLGESWHHNHHAFPRSAYHGLRWWEIDPSGLIITALARAGLAWNVVRIAPERQRAGNGHRSGLTSAPTLSSR